MWVAFAQILPQVMRIRWSLSLIFLEFKCVTMWIWRGWFRWDIHHAVSRDFWRWQLRHSLPRQTYPACLLRFSITTWQMTWGRLLCYDFHTIDALGMGSVCHIYTIVHFLQGAARCYHYFSCAISVQGESKTKRVLICRTAARYDVEKLAWSGFAARARFSYHKIFQKKRASRMQWSSLQLLKRSRFYSKRCSFLCTFSKPVKGEFFLRYPLSSKPNDFMPLIARKNQGSTPMPLLK